MNGLVAVVRVLLRAGAALDATNRIGQTPLIYAVIEKRPEVVAALLGAGADVNIGNRLHSGWAALHWAALTDSPPVVEAVLAGRPRNTPDLSGRRAQALAQEHGKTAVLEMLAKLEED